MRPLLTAAMNDTRQPFNNSLATALIGNPLKTD
jgi:hypothetical protein